MDIRSIFRNYLVLVITDGGTQEAKRAWRGPKGARLRHVGRSARQIRWVANPEVPKRDRKVAKSLTPRCREKPLRRELGTRTANRHRYARRKSSGASENPRLGTRQTGPVTSEEGVLDYRARSSRSRARTSCNKEAQATVY